MGWELWTGNMMGGILTTPGTSGNAGSKDNAGASGANSLSSPNLFAGDAVVSWRAEGTASNFKIWFHAGEAKIIRGFMLTNSNIRDYAGEVKLSYTTAYGDSSGTVVYAADPVERANTTAHVIPNPVNRQYWLLDVDLPAPGTDLRIGELACFTNRIILPEISQPYRGAISWGWQSGSQSSRLANGSIVRGLTGPPSRTCQIVFPHVGLAEDDPEGAVAEQILTSWEEDQEWAYGVGLLRDDWTTENQGPAYLCLPLSAPQVNVGEADGRSMLSLSLAEMTRGIVL